MGEGEGERLNQVGQVLSALELPSSVLSLSLSLSRSIDRSIDRSIERSIERTGDSCPLGQAPMGRNRQDFWGNLLGYPWGISKTNPKQRHTHQSREIKVPFTHRSSETPTTDRLLVPA